MALWSHLVQVFHLAASFEDDTFFDHQLRREDIASQASGLVELDGLLRVHIADDFTVDDDLTNVKFYKQLLFLHHLEHFNI